MRVIVTFRKELESTIEIEASSEQVWAILTDLERYPEWNPFIRRIEGSLIVGSQLEVRIKPPGRSETVFRPTIISVIPNRQLRWLGHLGMPKIFDGEHKMLIEPMGTGLVRFVQNETFHGLLVPLSGGVLSDTLRGFKEMNNALKERIEEKKTTVRKRE
jgi:hypothetical protein